MVSCRRADARTCSRTPSRRTCIVAHDDGEASREGGLDWAGVYEHISLPTRTSSGVKLGTLIWGAVKNRVLLEKVGPGRRSIRHDVTCCHDEAWKARLAELCTTWDVGPVSADVTRMMPEVLRPTGAGAMQGPCIRASHLHFLSTFGGRSVDQCRSGSARRPTTGSFRWSKHHASTFRGKVPKSLTRCACAQHQQPRNVLQS